MSLIDVTGIPHYVAGGQRYHLTGWGIEDVLKSETKRLMDLLTREQFQEIAYVYFAMIAGTF